MEEGEEGTVKRLFLVSEGEKENWWRKKEITL